RASRAIPASDASPATPAIPATPAAPARAAADGAPAAPIAAGLATDRVARVLAAQDAGNVARPVSHLTLELDGSTGVDRIRLDLRGTQLSAGIATRDAASADLLTARVGELRDALAGRGLSADTVRIATTGTVGAEPRALDRTLDRALERLATLGTAGVSAGDGGAASQGTAQQHAGRDAGREAGRESTPRDARRDDPHDRSHERPRREADTPSRDGRSRGRQSRG
ncbi:MAG TPA: hypothetical protein VEZ47_13150, partial [Gemmatirosa sp.]|nr:hypothetical protein [Gemmatirosa sp.]